MENLVKPFSIIGLFLIFSFNFLSANQLATHPDKTYFDFSGMNIIWELIEILENDEEPPGELWEALVQTPGYAALISHESGYGISYLKDNFYLVFKPSHQVELKEKQNLGSVKHFLDFKRRIPEVKAFQDWLEDSAVEKKSMDILRNWLPEGSLNENDHAPASFIIFTKDARGGYGRLIFDILYALGKGEAFLPLYAHEAFHYFRGKSMAYDEGDVLVPHEYILMSINMLQNEGTADHIDKFNIINKISDNGLTEYEIKYRDEYARSPEIIRVLDHELAKLMENQPNYNNAGNRMISSIPMSGHPTGFLMARAIHDELGKDELIDCYNNPFAFLYLYNIAAKQNGKIPVFSNEAMLGVNKLEKMYLPTTSDYLMEGALTTGVNAEATELFREIVRILENDQDPDPSYWDKFFSNPGYMNLFAAESYYTPDKFQNLISLVYKPSRQKELTKSVESGGSFILNHFLDHKKEIENIDLAVNDFLISGKFSKSVEAVSSFLELKPGQWPSPPVLSFVYFGNDLRYGYSAFLVDPLRLKSSPDDINYYLITYLIWNISDQNMKYSDSDLTLKQNAYLSGLNQIQRIGMADFISRETGDFQKLKLGEKYNQQLSDHRLLFESLDEHFIKAGSNPEIWSEFQILCNNLITRPGCPLGYFMVKAIVENEGKSSLNMLIGDPVAFFLSYQAVAEKLDAYPAFSERTIRMIETIKNLP